VNHGLQSPAESSNAIERDADRQMRERPKVWFEGYPSDAVACSPLGRSRGT
jgi:hypothetical protein